jgi:hypothetical protein
MQKLVLCLQLLTSVFLVAACGRGASVPENERSLTKLCGAPTLASSELDFASSEDLNKFLDVFKIKFIKTQNTPDATHVDQKVKEFVAEFLKFPRSLREHMSAQGVSIHLIYGEGVAEDPSFPADPLTHDGRRWSKVPGSGGNPTRVVINHLYDNHGSVNLVLHEHAHSLDLGATDLATLSSSAEWKKVMDEDKHLMGVLDHYCGDYCTKDAVEAFAEAFAMFYACDRSRDFVAHATLAQAYFQQLETQVRLKSKRSIFKESPLERPFVLYPARQ